MSIHVVCDILHMNSKRERNDDEYILFYKIKSHINLKK